MHACVCMLVLQMAVFVSVINSGWLMRFLNRLSFTYSAARWPPWPEGEEEEGGGGGLEVERRDANKKRGTSRKL